MNPVVAFHYYIDLSSNLVFPLSLSPGIRLTRQRVFPGHRSRQRGVLGALHHHPAVRRHLGNRRVPARPELTPRLILAENNREWNE